MLCLFTVAPTCADTRIEQLVMPGPLTQSHAKYENRCEECHQLLSKKAQTSLCRRCHEEIDDDIRARTGFHGRIKGIEDMECRRCHTDHAGRDADIVAFDEGSFEHDQTDFTLEGAHRRATCGACHEKDKALRDTPHDCHACHRDDDAHREKLGRKCEDCHDASNWQSAREDFDHEKTHFPLHGEHEKAACASCHPSQRYRDIARECHACHALNDVHGGRYGARCDECHTESDWTKPDFDHARDTRFALEGRHENVACDTCHPGRLYEDKAPRTCHGCHAGDDDHQGRYGRDCVDCHTPTGWSETRFHHDRDTKFPLRGRHAGLDCNACHAAGVAADEAPQDCHGCHRDDDRHEGRFGRKCEECHREESWQVLRFDHDKDTDYPLLGRHAAVACDACHAGGAYHEKLGTACIDCHRDNDPHRGEQGKACADCHAVDGWRTVKFDHDLTKFPLIGMHATTPCEGCHTSAVFRDTPEGCAECHRADDAHKGRLGADCTQCHNPNGWKLWSYDHDTQTDYRLDGAHRDLSCTACHTQVVDGPIELGTACQDCHAVDDVHDGVFGAACGDCHGTRTFREAEVRR